MTHTPINYQLIIDMKRILFFFFMLFAFVACKNNNADEQLTNGITPPTPLNYSVINVYPHDTSAFTEGLEFHAGTLYESTGDSDYKGISKLSKNEISTGKDLQKINLSKEYFGEGITILNNKIYQLTYKTGKCFVYDFKTFKKIGEFNYEGEGWGMTNDGKHLIMNNGNNNLYFRDPETFKIVNTVGVIDNNGPVAMINELEYVDGFIYANIWMTNYIIKIDAKSGRVIAKADFTNLINQYVPETITAGAYLNGIAYDNIGKKFFITGKNWSKLFEMKFN